MHLTLDVAGPPGIGFDADPATRWVSAEAGTGTRDNADATAVRRAYRLVRFGPVWPEPGHDPHLEDNMNSAVTGRRQNPRLRPPRYTADC